jgi:hypothetical protein
MTSRSGEMCMKYLKYEREPLQRALSGFSQDPRHTAHVATKTKGVPVRRPCSEPGVVVASLQVLQTSRLKPDRAR